MLQFIRFRNLSEEPNSPIYFSIPFSDGFGLKRIEKENGKLIPKTSSTQAPIIVRLVELPSI